MAGQGGFDRALLVATTGAVGVMAGFFFAFSVSVAPGLAGADTAAALAAMQGMNRAVGNPAFALAYFGAAALGALVLVRGLARRQPWPATLAAVLYLAGVVAVTALANLPLNRALAPLGPGAAAAVMPAWLAEWWRWIDLRSAAAGLAFGLMLLALRREAAGRGAAPAAAGRDAPLPRHGAHGPP